VRRTKGMDIWNLAYTHENGNKQIISTLVYICGTTKKCLHVRKQIQWAVVIYLSHAPTIYIRSSRGKEVQKNSFEQLCAYNTKFSAKERHQIFEKDRSIQKEKVHKSSLSFLLLSSSVLKISLLFWAIFSKAQLFLIWSK